MKILTGIQPSGKPHVGNYFGAMKPAIDLQSEPEGECYYFIADYHSMTSGTDGDALRNNVRELAIDFLACGLDPEKSVFFKQSAVPEVNELAWILSTVCPMPLLNKCHSYKDKVAQGISPNHALFAYPVLMAADILLYDSERVPVGKDQKQHLEVARSLVTKMNEAYGPDTVTMPEAIIREETELVIGTDGRKMSKSYGNALPIFGDEKKMRKSIMKIKTDSTPMEDPKPTDGSSVIALHKLFADEAGMQQMLAAHHEGGTGYGDIKKLLANAYWDYFAPMRARREEILKDPGYAEDVLKAGAEKAREKATQVMDRVRHAVGLV